MAEAPLRSLSDVEIEQQIGVYKASDPAATRGGFLKFLKANGMVAGWHRVTALWGPCPEASEAAKKAAATKAAKAVAAPPPAPAPVSVIESQSPVGVDEAVAREALLALEKDLNEKFPERRDVISGCLAALIAQEHVLLLGPPGTAKTLLVESIAGALSLSKFTHLMTAYTDPSEVFGPLDVSALKAGVRRVITDGLAPEAQVVILDEIFKANSAILNSLLTLINERKFHNGGKAVKCPLNSLFAASNEPPQDESLLALFDRLFLRYEVEYLKSEENFRKVMLGGLPKPAVSLSEAALLSAQAGAAAVKVSPETIDAMIDIRNKLKAESIVASDRRWVKSLAFAKAFAWLEGESATSPEHLWFLADALWSEADQKTSVKRIVMAATNTIAAKVQEIVMAAKEAVENVRRIAQYDRGGSLNEAAKVNEKLDHMLAEIDKLKAGASKKQHAGAVQGRLEVEFLKSELVKVVKQGAK